jgi:uncharacterized membrane protein
MLDLVKLIHLVGAIFWMGGMAFMLLALRPAAVGLLQPPERLMLMGAVWKRFFPVVLVSIVALFTTGTHLYTTAFRAVKVATGQGAVPLGWNLMLVLGLLMMVIFAYIYAVAFVKFKRAMTELDWPLAGKAAAQVHICMVANFALGWLAIAAVRLVR